MESMKKPTPKPRSKLLSDKGKQQMELEELRMAQVSEKYDSGIGSMSTVSMDRSVTGCDSTDYISRDQLCSEQPELMKNMADLVIGSGKHSSADDGFFSMSTDGKENRENSRTAVPFPRIINYHNPNTNVTAFDLIRSFAVTQELRYVLAPLRLHLLHQNEDGDTSLHLAIINCNEQIILQMIDVLRNPECFNIYNDLTQTPLHLAVITRQDKIAGKLIDYGANIDSVDRNGQTCVHLACQYGDLRSLRAIFKQRPFRPELAERLPEILETTNFDGLTPLCIAVKQNHIEIVKELIMLDVDVNAIDTKSGNTALHLAVEDNNLPMLACLLFQGKADPNVTSYNGSTPLHIAAGLKLDPIVATLVAIGANTLIENMEGDTAFGMESEDWEDVPDKYEIARETFDSSDDDMEEID
ncbi:nuclear factor NF-kappa-B p105 subunit-like [Dendronephthya gigantea]|uniref:nuclear factor NF-kappa-B p105 subunit-like n=1 Tax=Dendronephthya gigantea TaxID=151771 RepID=UPI001069F2DD|nr:nuclear factor NF-kappa-B p105 subunit-like [Dendronephthya gigantea]